MSGNIIIEVGRVMGRVGVRVKKIIWFGGWKKGFRVGWRCRF